MKKLRARWAEVVGAKRCQPISELHPTAAIRSPSPFENVLDFAWIEHLGRPQ